MAIHYKNSNHHSYPNCACGHGTYRYTSDIHKVTCIMCIKAIGISVDLNNRRESMTIKKKYTKNSRG